MPGRKGAARDIIPFVRAAIGPDRNIIQMNGSGSMFVCIRENAGCVADDEFVTPNCHERKPNFEVNLPNIFFSSFRQTYTRRRLTVAIES